MSNDPLLELVEQIWSVINTQHRDISAVELVDCFKFANASYKLDSPKPKEPEIKVEKTPKPEPPSPSAGQNLQEEKKVEADDDFMEFDTDKQPTSPIDIPKT